MPRCPVELRHLAVDLALVEFWHLGVGLCAQLRGDRVSEEGEVVCDVRLILRVGRCRPCVVRPPGSILY